MTRILTFNVHSCVGTDRRLDVGRIADVIAAQSPDIVALQEVDVGRARTGGVDQAHAIAERLGMVSRFNVTGRVEEEAYGDAILTSLPERLVKAGPLPAYALLRMEPRGALWVAIDVCGRDLQVVNTHLGLAPPEQLVQVKALLGPEWLGRSARSDPTILVGDLNTGARGAACRRLRARLNDARAAVRRAGSTATFPSNMPLRRLDHVFVSDAIRVRSIHVANDALARRASDHLPLVVDFEIMKPVGTNSRNEN